MVKVSNTLIIKLKILKYLVNVNVVIRTYAYVGYNWQTENDYLLLIYLYLSLTHNFDICVCYLKQDPLSNYFFILMFLVYYVLLNKPWPSSKCFNIYSSHTIL